MEPIKPKQGPALEKDSTGKHRMMVRLPDGRHMAEARLIMMNFLHTKNIPRSIHIHHKDENPENNKVDNLEWCTHLYNMRYGTRTFRQSESKSKPVIQKSMDGVFIKRWDSGVSAALEGYSRSCISECCLGRSKHHRGFIWIFDK